MNIILAFKHTIGKEASFTKRKGADAVKWWTKSKYYHVEVVVEDTWISSHTDRGVVANKLLPLTDTKYDYFYLEIPDKTEKNMKSFWNFVESQEDTGYDWKGIYLSQFMFLDNDSVNKWFCSEIVTRLLQLLDCEHVQALRPNRVSPGDLFRKIEQYLTQINLKG